MLIDGNDVTFMTGALAEIGSWTERAIVVFAFESVTSSGTTEEAGDPSTVTFGTRSDLARINRVDLKMIEKSNGRYQANDQLVSIRGSFTKDDSIVWDTGTYRALDGPWKFYMGSNLYWQGIFRGVQS